MNGEKPITVAFKPLTDAALKLEDAPKQIFEAVESTPKNLVLGLKHANERLDEVVVASKDLADPVRFGEIAKNLAKISGNIDSEAVKNTAAKFISGVLNNVTSTTERVLMTNPVTGIPLATGLSFVNAARNVGDAVEGATKIANNAVKKTTNLSQGGGGAKTRRQLKNIIKHRHLIQTRTNKMIREFLGHTTTQNKKYIPKKSKRRRRR